MTYSYLVLTARLAQLPAHDTQVDVRRNDADERRTVSEVDVERDLFFVAVSTEDAVAFREDRPLRRERILLPERGQDRRLDLLGTWAKHLVVEFLELLAVLSGEFKVLDLLRKAIQELSGRFGPLTSCFGETFLRDFVTPLLALMLVPVCICGRAFSASMICLTCSSGAFATLLTTSATT